MPFEPGATLGRFQIRAPLGAGGMGLVYRAHDPLLQRDVALKVLDVSRLTDPSARAALIREARAAAALNHPNICTVYEVGEAGGHVFIAMECIEGVRLDRLLERERLNIDQTIRLGEQLADAVSQAHHAGIIHRDVKSANVIVTADGRVKVLDFGIARQTIATVADITRSVDPLDALGIVAGTLPYMAPETLRGEPATARSDVWSLGVVLHEMASGERPFRAPTGLELTSAILRDPPTPLGAEVPAAVAAVIRRALAKNPAERYADAGELRAALEAIDPRSAVVASAPRRRIYIGLLAAIGIVALAAFVIAWRSRTVSPAIETLAVLPFENLTHDPSQDFFADGMTEELTTTLARSGTLTVISRTSAMRFRGTREPLPRIARALGADALLAGSVLKAGGRIRINVQLVHGTSDRNLWADSFEESYDDVLTLQTAIARAVTAQVRTRLAAEAPAAAPARIDPRAYESYLLGRAYARQRNAESMDKGVEYLQQAIVLQPAWAVAHAALAEAYRERDTWGGLGTGKSAALVRAEAERALELDDTLAEAHLAMGRWRYDHEWNWTGAEREFTRALQLNPSLGEAHVGYAFLLETLGRSDDAVASAERGVKLEPLSPSMLSDLGRILYRARRYQESVEAFHRALRLEPDYVPALDRLFSAEAVQGHVEQLQTIGARLERQAAKLPPLALELKKALVAWRAADVNTVRRIASTIERSTPPARAGERAMALAILHALSGNRDAAMRWLERGVAERSLFPLQLRDPLLDGVRRDRRFIALLHRLAMPE